jgi:phage shock protein E
MLRYAWLLFLWITSAYAAEFRYQGIKPDVIIDVRTPAEYGGGHIEGAINIPVERISQDIGKIRGVGPDSRILLYCRSGRRSAMAAEALHQQGYRRILDGGAIEATARALTQCASSAC